jgi:hypothetical protein
MLLHCGDLLDDLSNQMPLLALLDIAIEDARLRRWVEQRNVARLRMRANQRPTEAAGLDAQRRR